jgi:hypothetical protein
MGYTLLAITTLNKLKAKATPVIKSYACKECGTIASVSVKGNSITVNKCNCKGVK